MRQHTNNAERQQQVWYTNTAFLTASRFVSKVESKIVSISDLKGKTIVSPAARLTSSRRSNSITD